MKEKLGELQKKFEEEIASITSEEGLEEIRIRYVGRKQGLVSDLMKGLRELPAEERPEAGQLANEFKQFVEKEIFSKAEALKFSDHDRVRTVRDITLPGLPVAFGRKHPVTVVREELEDIFISMGYSIEHGPHVESDYNNFVALNIPKNHPARDNQATFFIDAERLLRTHTSPVQVRAMKKRRPPLMVIAPGTVYRKDYDISHTPMFSQIEGLVVGEGVSMSHLKGTLEHFCTRCFGAGTEIRLRPSYFPFTEPSVEVDVSCVVCGGTGCRTCSKSGWLEILGAGMVDPEVFRMAGYDNERISGFAFGLGVERVTMLKFGIQDLRSCFENDIRFLEQSY